MKAVIKPLLLLGFIFLSNTTFSQIHSLELNFKDSISDSGFSKKLASLKLRKGEFFCVKINNINPYHYNINITTKNDTFKAGQEPVLFTQFMDPSQLGEIAANLLIGAPAAIIQKEEDKKSKEEALKEKKKLKLFLDKSTEKHTLTKLDNEMRELESEIEKTEDEIKALKSSIKDGKDKDSLAYYVAQIEELYTDINNHYTRSIERIIETHNEAKKPRPSSDQNLDKLKLSIEKIILTKSLFKHELNLSRSKKLISDSVYRELLKEMDSKKYSSLYLNNIYLKAYSNFLIADNAEALSTYYSFPIQVRGDAVELKIDITPKAAAGKKEEEKKKEEDGKTVNTNTNSLSNQSPVTVNVNPAAPKSPDSTPPSNEALLTAEELKVVMPAAVREYHLSYKYRVNQTFYGFSTGFFIDGLQNDNYNNKPSDPTDPATTYELVEEEQDFIGSYGIMASVNGGAYFCKKRNVFWQLFAGPGLTVETKLQPRLLLGAGVGAGEKNKFSLNGGVSIGQVKRLSGIFDTSASYAIPQTDLYYARTGFSWFFSVNYVFDLRK